MEQGCLKAATQLRIERRNVENDKPLRQAVIGAEPGTTDIRVEVNLTLN
jgi:hypothetical protein